MTRLYTNNAVSKINGAITFDATTLDVQVGDGSKFPAAGGGDDFIVGIWDDQGNHELAVVTNVATDTFTITRGDAGTTARNWPDGALIEHLISAGDIAIFRDHTHAQYSLLAHLHEGDYVNIVGDTMSGPLAVPTAAAASDDTQVASTQWVNDRYKHKDLAMFYPSLLPAGQVLLDIVVANPFSFPSLATGDGTVRGESDIASTGTCRVRLYKNGVEFAVIGVNTSATVNSVTYTPTTSFAAGDRLLVQMDSTDTGFQLENFMLNLVAEQTF